jgi:hypothetical protein
MVTATSNKPVWIGDEYIGPIDRVKLIEALDLGSILAKVRKNNPRMTQLELMNAEEEYRKFLVRAINPAASLVCTVADIVIWKQHILNTRKYSEDCLRCLGYFLHMPDHIA